MEKIKDKAIKSMGWIIILTQAFLTALKVNGIVDWPWVVISIPIILAAVIFAIILIISRVKGSE